MSYRSLHPNDREMHQLRQLIPSHLPFDTLSVILNGIAVLGAIAFLLFLWLGWSTIEETVPLHINFWGQIDRWGNKNELIPIIILMWVVSVLIFIVQFFPRLWSIPYRFDEATVLTMLMINRRLLAFIHCFCIIELDLMVLPCLYGGEIVIAAAKIEIIMIFFAVGGVTYYWRLMKKIARQS